jgi:BirA family biotin operon repressor/biotin-[acetyl-CoA-carboxylase] ligase
LFEAKIVGVGDFGQLKLKERDGQTSEFMFKEVEFVFEDES